MKEKMCENTCTCFSEHTAIKDAKVVMSYMAFAGEADLAELHAVLRIV